MGVDARRERYRQGVTEPIVTERAMRRIIKEFEELHAWHMDAVGSWGVMCSEDCLDCQKWAVIQALVQAYDGRG